MASSVDIYPIGSYLSIMVQDGKASWEKDVIIDGKPKRQVFIAPNGYVHIHNEDLVCRTAAVLRTHYTQLKGLTSASNKVAKQVEESLKIDTPFHHISIVPKITREYNSTHITYHLTAKLYCGDHALSSDIDKMTKLINDFTSAVRTIGVKY